MHIILRIVCAVHAGMHHAAQLHYTFIEFKVYSIILSTASFLLRVEVRHIERILRIAIPAAVGTIGLETLRHMMHTIG